MFFSHKIYSRRIALFLKITGLTSKTIGNDILCSSVIRLALPGIFPTLSYFHEVNRNLVIGNVSQKRNPVRFINPFTYRQIVVK